MIKITQIGNVIPVSYPVDPLAKFEPGIIAQLYLRGNNLGVASVR
jgi:hypothetical protein